MEVCYEYERGDNPVQILSSFSSNSVFVRSLMLFLQTGKDHFYDLGVIDLAGIRTVASEVTTRTSAA